MNNIIIGHRNYPPRMVIFGPEKIGKTTLAAQLPNPIFIKAEEGTGALDIARVSFDNGRELVTSYQEVIETLQFLAEQEHEFQSVVIDSLTSLEPLLQHKVCDDYNEPNILGNTKGSKFAYQAGLKIAGKEWESLLSALTYLSEQRKMVVCLIAHSAVAKFKSPETDDYDYYEIDVDKVCAAGLIKKWADMILFCNFEKPIVMTESDSFGKKKGKARLDEQPQRVIYTERRFTHTAGNRYSLPYEIEFELQGTMSKILKEISKKMENK